MYSSSIFSFKSLKSSLDAKIVNWIIFEKPEPNFFYMIFERKFQFFHRVSRSGFSSAYSKTSNHDSCQGTDTDENVSSASE